MMIDVCFLPERADCFVCKSPVFCIGVLLPAIGADNIKPETMNLYSKSGLSAIKGDRRVVDFPADRFTV